MKDVKIFLKDGKHTVDRKCISRGEKAEVKWSQGGKTAQGRHMVLSTRKPVSLDEQLWQKTDMKRKVKNE